MIDIISYNHKDMINTLFLESKDKIRIISPFLSKQMASLLAEAARNGVDCSFITRFYLQDFLDGANSLDGLQEMLDAHVNLYAVIGLHTKLYLFDNNKAIVGSANFTEGGLVRNIELSVFMSDEPTIDKLNDHYSEILDAVNKADEGIITQEMINDFKERYDKIKNEKSKTKGGTSIYYNMKGAALDTKSKRLKNNNGVSEELEININEKFSDPVYLCLGGKTDKISHKNLRNIILKFSHSDKDRADANQPMNVNLVKDNGKEIYITNFSRSKKKSAEKVEEGDEIFFCVHSYDKNGDKSPMIAGKGYFRQYHSNNDAQKKDWFKTMDWLKDYPIYCVIEKAKILDTPLKNCIPLREITEILGFNTYMKSRDNPEKYKNVKNLHSQQAMMLISPEAKEYIDLKLDELGEQYGWMEYESE
jgi:HKD family nuclease